MPVLSALAFCLALVPSPQVDSSLARHIYPLAKQVPCPPVEVDVSDFPSSKAWGDTARELVRDWFPYTWSMLSTNNVTPPKRIRLVIKKELPVPAWASGDTITINGKWITEHPDDLGMVIHELTHVIQRYPRNKADTGWLVEGIADYIRWWRYEPEAPRPRIDPAKNKHTDAYRVTAYFLAWVSKNHHMGLVPALDAALRKGEDPARIFVQMTGKDAESLWKDFVASLR